MSKIDWSECLLFDKQPLEMLARDYWQPDDPFKGRAEAEIAVRVARAQIEAAQAQIKAARYMRWSVVVLIASVLIQATAWLWPNLPS